MFLNEMLPELVQESASRTDANMTVIDSKIQLNWHYQGIDVKARIKVIAIDLLFIWKKEVTNALCRKKISCPFLL